MSILETVQRHMGQLQACMDKQESRTTTGTEMSQHPLEQTIERSNKELTGCREQPTSQSVHAAKG